jgi:hypothetical protein
VVVGLGLQGLQVPGDDNPYGASLAGRLGVGLRANVRRYRFTLEASRHLVATDYGTGGDWVHVRYLPITLGVAF